MEPPLVPDFEGWCRSRFPLSSAAHGGIDEKESQVNLDFSLFNPGIFENLMVFDFKGLNLGNPVFAEIAASNHAKIGK